MAPMGSPRLLTALVKTVGLSIVCLAVLAAMNVLVLQGVGRPVRWGLPDGYRGWVVTEFDRPSCPALEAQGLHIVVKVPPSGCVCTSSASVWNVWRSHDHVYVQPDGTRTPIERSSRGNQEIRPVTGELFFVGSKAELEQRGWGSQPRLMRDRGDPCAGS